jgi:small subunit ribosomal protein S12
VLSSIRKVRVVKYRRQALANCPHKSGYCVKVFIRTPKKPCSARRAVTFVRLSNNYYILCKIQGELSKHPFHKLTQFSKVLVRGGRSLDIPACKYRLAFTNNVKFDSLRPLD